MSVEPPLQPFRPSPADAAGILSWIHIGDLHMTKAGEQNDLDLNAIVDEINQTFPGSVSFVYRFNRIYVQNCGTRKCCGSASQKLFQFYYLPARYNFVDSKYG